MLISCVDIDSISVQVSNGLLSLATQAIKKNFTSILVTQALRYLLLYKSLGLSSVFILLSAVSSSNHGSHLPGCFVTLLSSDLPSAVELGGVMILIYLS